MARAHFADRAYPLADSELFLLAGIKIQKAQIQFAAAVLEAAHQRAARTKSDLAVGDDTLHLHRFARLHGGDRREAGLVLVTQRQMQQQVGAVLDAELGELAQRGGGDFCGWVQLNAGRTSQGMGLLPGLAIAMLTAGADMPVKCFHHGMRLKMIIIDMPFAVRNAVAPIRERINIQEFESCSQRLLF
jgi:hypothetical protein